MKRKKANPGIRRIDLNIVPAGGGVLFRIRESVPEILLIKRKGVWDLPKGKKEKNETIEHCAIREVAEETGVPLPYLVSGLKETLHDFTMNGQQLVKKTTWFSMILYDSESSLKPQIEEEITDLQWVEAKKALELVGYENLKEVIKQFLDKMGK